MPKITQKQLWNYYFSCLHDLAYLCYDLLDYKYRPELFSGNPDFYNGAVRDAQNVLMSLDGAEQCFSQELPYNWQFGRNHQRLPYNSDQCHILSKNVLWV